jgi:hypothetical protein
MTPQQDIRFTDGDFHYEIGAFDDYLICIPCLGNPEVDEWDDYVEIHMNDLSEYERSIFDFLTKVTKERQHA